MIKCGFNAPETPFVPPEPVVMPNLQPYQLAFLNGGKISVASTPRLPSRPAVRGFSGNLFIDHVEAAR
jgi:hypothetical protein